MTKTKSSRKLAYAWAEQSDMLERAFVELGNYKTIRQNDTRFLVVGPRNRTRAFYCTASQNAASVYLAKMKPFMKEVFEYHKIPTPKGFVTKWSTVVPLIYPLVTKRVDGTGGRGTTLNIQNVQELKKGIELARKGSSEVLIEEYLPGDVYRILVIGYEVAHVMKLHRSHVVGDGKSTMLDLVKQKNKRNVNNPTVAAIPFKRSDPSRYKVLNEGQIHYFSEMPSRTYGGDTEVIENLPEYYKHLAEQASLVAGLPVNGVDLLVHRGNPYVLECNAYPNLSVHYHPTIGTGIDPAALLVKYYMEEI